jgi:hypothetical protein
VVDSGRPVTGFTDKGTLKDYLKRMGGTFNRPPIYRLDDGHEPVIMTLSRAMAGGLDVKAPARRDDLPPGYGRSSGIDDGEKNPLRPDVAIRAFYCARSWTYPHG